MISLAQPWISPAMSVLVCLEDRYCHFEPLRSLSCLHDRPKRFAVCLVWSVVVLHAVLVHVHRAEIVYLDIYTPWPIYSHRNEVKVRLSINLEIVGPPTVLGTFRSQRTIPIYPPLVISHSELENHHAINGKIPINPWAMFKFANCDSHYQRVNPMKIP